MTIEPIALTRAPDEPLDLAAVAVVLHEDDQIAVAKTALAARTQLIHDGGVIRTTALIPPGHKFAVAPVAEGDPVRRYGQVIGFATRSVEPGDHVHSQNLAVGKLDLDYAFCRDYAPVDLVPETERRTFDGFRRPDGRVGTRNYVAVLASVNCSSSAVVAVVDSVTRSGALERIRTSTGSSAFRTRAAAVRTSGRRRFISSSGRSRASSTTRTSRGT